MKKLLSLLGTISITASGSSAAVAIGVKPNIQTVENKNISNFNNPETDIYFQINNLKEAYNALSENEKINFAKKMAKLPKLKNNEINYFLANSNVDFIRNNQETIEMMYLINNSITQFSLASSSTFASLENVNWKEVNQYLNLGFGDSNNYTWKVGAYSPSKWWKFWEWGSIVDIPEGAVNYFRLIKLAFSYYNLVNFDPLERLLESAKNIFDYLVKIEQHGYDKGVVLYDMLVKFTNELKSSRLPFTKAFYDKLEEVIFELEEPKRIEIFPGMWAEIEPRETLIKVILEYGRDEIEETLGIAIEEFGKKFYDITNEIIKPLKLTTLFINLANIILPGVAWAFIFLALEPITNQIVNADKDHNGVYIQFQQFVIPLGFRTR